MRFRLLLPVIFLFFLSVPAIALSQTSTEAKNILILHSYHPELEWTRDVMEGMQDVIASSGLKVNIYTEYMDTKRHSPEISFGYLEELYRRKYANTFFDLILISDNNALKFLVDRQDSFFPGTPVVFCGINNFDKTLLGNRKNITGVAEKIDIQGTIELAKRLVPGTRKFIIVNDKTPTGEKTLEQLMDTISQPPGYRRQFKIVNDISARDLGIYLSKLPSDRVVLVFSFYKDNAEKWLSTREFLSLINTHSPVPIFSFWSHYMGHGPLGGVMVDGREQGRQCAQYGMRILKGESAESLPIVTHSPNLTLIDWRKLHRWKIDENRLPPDSRILFKQPSHWQEHKYQIISTFIILILQGLFIFALIMQLLNRKKAEAALNRHLEEMDAVIKERTKRLSETVSELESLFSSSQVGIAVFKEDRVYARGNQRLAEILGYQSPKELEGRSAKIVHATENSFIQFGKDYYPMLRQGKIIRCEQELVRKDGSTVWCSVSGKALDNESPIDLNKGILWMVDDISELKRSNSELEQFAYAVSHDLQEPIRVMTGFLQLLQSRYQNRLDEKADHYIERAVNAGRRMQELILGLLKLSRVSTEVQPMAPVHLNEIMAQVMESLQPMIDEKKATVSCGKLPELQGDALQIESLFLNLMTNAVKYNQSSPPVVEIGCIETEGDYSLYVKDNGIGIAPKFHQKIFQVFQRLHTEKEYPGTGIGLSLCKKIVERHGGRIWVESDTGKGSVFYLAFSKQENRND